MRIKRTIITLIITAILLSSLTGCIQKYVVESLATEYVSYSPVQATATPNPTATATPEPTPRAILNENDMYSFEHAMDVFDYYAGIEVIKKCLADAKSDTELETLEQIKTLMKENQNDIDNYNLAIFEGDYGYQISVEHDKRYSQPLNAVFTANGDFILYTILVSNDFYIFDRVQIDINGKGPLELSYSKGEQDVRANETVMVNIGIKKMSKNGIDYLADIDNASVWFFSGNDAMYGICDESRIDEIKAICTIATRHNQLMDLVENTYFDYNDEIIG